MIVVLSSGQKKKLKLEEETVREILIAGTA